MKTVRDHITGNPAAPAPPPGATHILCWEPHPRHETRWEMTALDAQPYTDDPASALPADASGTELVRFASGVLGYPVTLSRRFEVPDESGETAVAYYVIPDR